MKKRELFVGLALSLIFFLVSILTISDYNVNWDEPVHFMRGQAYLRYLSTGQRNYGKLPLFKEFQEYFRNRKEKPSITLPRYSLYQDSVLDGDYFLENDAGHPPLNGILASLTNYIFYQKLGIVGDIESYHLFALVLSSVLVLIVFLFAYQTYGIFAGIISALSLSLYPLFLAESHSNIKDPVEAFFYTLTIYSFYQGVKDKSWKWFVTSSIFCGFALGTKLNIFFVPFIILPWLLAKYYQAILKFKQKIVFKILKIPKKILLSLIVYPFVVFIIFFATWPYLWGDPFVRIFSVLGFYKQMGGSGIYNQPSSFYIHGFNTYPAQTILFTTPLVVLFFSLIGVISAVFFFKKEKQRTSFLWLLWFLIPIFRVSVPGASIYGGLRQIMEYIPAMALLSGLGAKYLVAGVAQFIARGRRMNSAIPFLSILVVLMFLPITLKMIQLHPNQNLYFNPLIGGLKGAVARDFPGWGATLGNPYLQGVKWLNQNAEPDSTLVLSWGLMTNVPVIKLRKDIEYANNLASTILRDGEYIMGLTGHEQFLLYDGQYPERYLVPVYEKKVEGMPILRIWKNDLAHTKKGFIEEKDVSSETTITVKDYGLLLDFQKPVFLTRVESFFNEIKCKEIKRGVISTSVDGISWKQEAEGLLQLQIPRVKKMEKGKITHLFAALPARYLRIEVIPHNSCLFNGFKITALRDLNP